MTTTTRKPLLTIRSHTGYSRLLYGGDIELDEEEMPVIVREIPAIPEIPSPYSFSAEWEVYRFRGREVVIRETSHRCHQVFAVQPHDHQTHEPTQGVPVMQPTTTTTRILAGHELSLTPGRRYLATRPMARDLGQLFDVKITDVTDGVRIDAHAAAVVEDLTYDEANKLLAAFNSGETSFEGRIWE
jgi:hypothetical protein